MSHRFYILAGEKSGDLIGSRLIKALRTRFPSAYFAGVGGQEMRDAGLKGVLRTEDFEIHGFSAVLRSLPKLRKQFREVRGQILKMQPAAVILIDYPGFNIRLAKSLRKHGFTGKVVQYVSPTVWAWGKHRKHDLAKTLDLLLTIYPFEAPYFFDTPLNVKYVGNPIHEIVKEHRYDTHWASLFGIQNTGNLIALFPGSRKSEIQLNLPYQLKVCEMLKKEHPGLVFAISCAHDKIVPVMHPLLRNNSLKLYHDLFLLPKAYSYELMRDCRAAIAKSGTVTLELALHAKPAVVIYKLTLFNRLIARYFLRLNLPHYCIVNIISGKRIYPELIDKGLSIKNLFQAFKSLVDETEERALCIEQCRELPHILQSRKASDEAAAAVGDLLE